MAIYSSPLTIFAGLILTVALAAAVAPAHAAKTAESTAWQSARQLVLVTTAGWDVDRGQLRTYQRHDGRWQQVGAAVPVTVGKAGAAWGVGLSTPLHDGGPIKREGDNRSPAGVFTIGEAFGYAARADTAMGYRALSASDYCVDVSSSPQYNRIVDERKVGAAAVKGSTEPMRRDLHAHGDQRYRQGFVIEHNPNAVPQQGSCIFAHLWKSPGTATTGCTAMQPKVMQRLLAWLKPQEQPVFVLLPQAELARLHEVWHLPLAPAAP